MSEEATIKIRKNWELFGNFNKTHLFLDGKDVGTIANGEEVPITVTSGRHSVFIKRGYRSNTIDFTLTAGGNKSFVVEQRIGWNWALPCCILVGGTALSGTDFYLIQTHNHSNAALQGVFILGTCYLLILLFIFIQLFKPGRCYVLKEVHDPE
jgi:hypothetical protein